LSFSLIAEISPGHFQFTDPQATNTLQGFYRLRSPIRIADVRIGSKMVQPKRAEPEFGAPRAGDEGRRFKPK
jgi:hypothetical protein